MKSRKGVILSIVVVALALCCVVPASAATSTHQPTAATVSVDITRDSYGVPHIYSTSEVGLFYGYGYVAAQDRLFQLEISKRTALGRVAEIYGPDFLDYDKVTRRDGYTLQEIEAQIEALPKRYQDILKAFADGINQCIAEAKKDPGKMPKEFTDLGFSPTEWTSAEVIAPFIHAIGFQFMDNFAYRAEIYNAALLKYLQGEYGEDTAAAMFEDVVWYEDPSAVTTDPRSAGSAANVEAMRPLFASLPEGISQVAKAVEAERNIVDGVLTELGMGTRSASNMVVISPQKSESGEAMLMGGPQFWWTVPGFLMEVGLHGAGFNCVGTTVVSFPFVMFGHSDHHAWSSTYGVGNLVDNYLLTLNPDNAEQYWYNGAWKDMEKRIETIKVKGQPDSVELLYRSVHGPVYNVLPDNQAYARRRAFEGRDLMTWVGYLESNRAADVEEFREAAEKAAYSMNWFYADTGGDIAHFYLGHYPVRPTGLDDRLPAPGNGEFEWAGFAPFADNPSCVNPKQGYLAQWNNQPGPGWRNGERQSGWGSANRVEAIMDFLAPNPAVNFSDLQEVVRRAGLIDVTAKYFKEDLIAAAAKVDDPKVQQAVAQLRAWDNMWADVDNDGKYDSVGQTVYEKWLSTMLAATFRDEFGEFLDYSHPLDDISTATAMLYHVLEGGDSSLPAHVDYLAPLTADEARVDSLLAALAALEAEHGPDMSEWLTRVRTGDFVSMNFLGIPQSFGETYSIIFQNRGTQNHLVRLSAEGVVGVNINPPGQSGFVAPSGELNPHYSDQLELYENWEYKPMLLKDEDVAADAESRERLFYPLQEAAFPDVPATHRFYEAIRYLGQRGIVGGYADGRYGPDDPVKRAQVAKIAVLALGHHDEEVTNLNRPTFPDVVYGGQLYPFDYVEEAVAQGIVSGYSNGLFGPYDDITRIQLIRMVVRAAGDALTEPPAGYNTGFIDIPLGDEAVVAKAKYNGLVSGATPTTLDPYATATRGHVAQLMYSALVLQ